MRVVVIGNNVKSRSIVERGLREAGYAIVAQMDNAENLLKQAYDLVVDAIVIDSDNPDRDLLDQLSKVYSAYPCPIVIFTRCNERWVSSAAVKSGVSAYVVDGLSVERIKPIMDVAITRFSEIQTLKKELEAATTHLHERKFIERAKGILMKRNNFAEDTAYKALRSMAMDRNKRIADIAESIITAEELLSHS